MFAKQQPYTPNLNPCKKCGQPPAHVRGERSTGKGASRDSVHCRPCGQEVIGDWGGEVEAKWNALNPAPSLIR